MNPQIQGCMEKIREMNVSDRKKIQLCSVLAGIENNNNEEAKLEEWYEFLDLFFNDYSIVEEIYKKMKTNGLCFLHEVGIYRYKDYDKPDFYVLKNAGKPNQTTHGEWNPQMYYETNIRDCKQKLMAIPIALTGKNGHSNMLIIRKKKQKNPIKNMGAYLNKTIIKKEENKTTWEIEHFEPHGKQNEHEERYVNRAIVNLVHDILKHDPEYNKDNIKITHPNQLCKLTTRTHETLQQILYHDTKYNGSCSMFSMWYSFNRVLYPEKESAQIYEEMNHTLLSSKNPSETIENIILSFVSLINIDIDSFKVGNDRLLLPTTQIEIETKKNIGKGLRKTRKMKKKKQGKHKKRSTKPKIKNNYKRNI